MNAETQVIEPFSLASGAGLPNAASGCVWRLESGALRLHSTERDATSSLLNLALPGDLIGVERALGLAYPHSGYAITPSTLTAVSVADYDIADLMTQAYLVSRQRCADMVALRSGSVPNRVRFLLLLLADHQDSTQRASNNVLPSLRDMATMVGSTVETVSRVLASLRQFDVLHERKAHGGKLNISHLRHFHFLPGITSSSLRVKQHQL